MNEKIPPLGVKLAYALPAFALAVAGIPIYIYIPKFYTDTVGLDMAAAGIIVLGLRLFDAVTDPIMGLLSDHTTFRSGRRRPYILTGSILLGTALLFLFNPPIPTPVSPAAWFSVWMGAVFLFWTVTTVPYESMGPEITFDYHQRTVLFGIRDGFLIAGTLTAAAVPVFIRRVLLGSGLSDDDPAVFLIMSLLYAPLVVICCLICIRRVRERAKSASPHPVHFFRGIRAAFKNRPFLILMAAFCLSAAASQLPAALLLYYVEYVLHSAHAEWYLVIYLGAGVLFLPGWVHLARKIGKKGAWILSMIVNTAAFFFVYRLGPGDAAIYGVLVGLSGIGFGAGLALPSALTADVIDYDQTLTGQRREGQYIGIFSVVKKAAGAFGAGIGLFLLGVTGYSPNTVQSAAVVDMLRLLYALVPCFLSIAAIGVAAFYPLGPSEHEQVLAAIRDMETEAANPEAAKE